jgi:pimeloyl-ACP methyl ester carboxylesterase
MILPTTQSALPWTRRLCSAAATALVLAAPLACYHRKGENAGSASPQESRSGQIALSKWQELELSHATSDIQSSCRPVHAQANAGVNFRGSILLFHGFSACPQQYEELIPILTGAGFDVWVPLYPGHGVVPKSMKPRVDDTFYVPNSSVLWEAFVDDMNELAKGFRGGPRLLVGLSHGANVALRAMQKSPDLYDRAVLIAPKLKTEASLFTGLFSNQLKLFNIDDFIADRLSGWKKCEEDSLRKPVGRGGFCYMENRKAIAMLEFGKTVVEGSTVRGGGRVPKAAVQAILSTFDDGVANQAAVKVFENMRGSGQDLTVCTMPKGIPHSMFSKYDFPYEKPWVDELFAGVLAFARDQKPYAGSKPEGGLCELANSPVLP